MRGPFIEVRSMTFKFGIPSELVAQTVAGATGGGVAAMLANPALAPLWGALAALVLALIQAAIRKVRGRPGEDDNAALKAAAVVAAEAALDALLKAREAQRDAKASASGGGPSVPPGAALALVLGFALASATVPGCNPALGPLDYARGTLNAVAAGVNAGGEQALDAYCVAQLRAAGRSGHRTEGGQCVAQGPARAATPEDRAAVVQVRADWRPVLVAHDAVVDAHEVAVSLVRASDNAVASRFVPALANLTESYGRLGVALGRFGVNIPPVFPVSGDAGADGGTDAAPDADASESE